jgi:hypothetical protein
LSTIKGPSVVISSSSQAREASWTCLAHYTGVEIQRQAATQVRALGARKNAIEAYLAIDDRFDNQTILQVASSARQLPYIARGDDVARAILEGLDVVWTGRQTAGVAMVEVAR